MTRRWAAWLLSLAALDARAAPMEFDFGPGGSASGHPAYDPQRGFGFDPGSAARFSVRLPEGNYRVTVSLGGGAAGATTLLAEQHRLMLEDVRTTRRTSLERSVIVNVRTAALAAPPPNAPGGDTVRLKPREIGSLTWDDRLTLEFAGATPLVTALRIEPADVPTLYLAGDSTVTDQAVAPSASWGQMLPRFFAPDVAIANHAESGETLKSFVTELRLDKLLSNLKAGDWVMIQFGHNDQKAQWPQTYVEAGSTYRSWLRVYLAEVRRHGATPILVTSPERRNFDDAGHIVNSLGEYPQAVRDVAREEGVALVDLHEMSRRFYEALGPGLAARAFADRGRDRTHHDEYGAYALARMVVEGLRAADRRLLAGLDGHIAGDAGRFDPAHPALPPH
ncbi:MAG TPA: rhamnogalacturonan acetylesterase [Steroidobacteraceae bacterium]